MATDPSPSVSIATENPKTYTRSDITLAPTPKFPLARKVLSHRVAGRQTCLSLALAKFPLGKSAASAIHQKMRVEILYPTVSCRVRDSCFGPEIIRRKNAKISWKCQKSLRSPIDSSSADGTIRLSVSCLVKICNNLTPQIP